MIAGRVLYVSQEVVWLARGRALLRSTDGGQTWQRRAMLPFCGFRERFAMHRLGRRLGRVGFHHLVATGPGSALAVAHQHFFSLRPGDEELQRGTALVGSRPLALCLSGDSVYYGEYRGNSERSPVHIWRADPDGEGWKPVWRFDNVRHIHGVFRDPYTREIWVTTGDSDDESAIYKTADGFQSLKRVVGGSQTYRAVQLLFTRKHVYFGSDAPEQQNYLVRVSRNSGEVERLQPVAGPVFYGCQVGSLLAFSTVVEPSRVNLGRDAELWVSESGDNWTRLATHRKDVWSQKYFQYGQILFPAGPGDGKHLWYTPRATDQDEMTICMPLSSILRHLHLQETERNDL